MLDRFEREISYLRISVTDKCNLRCLYCMPPEGVPARRHGDFLTLEMFTEAARAAVSLGVRKVRLTGGEPLVKRGIEDLVRMLHGIEGLEHLAMTSNGTLLAPRARRLREAGLSSVNVSLDSLDPDRYRALTRGGAVEDAVAGIRAAIEAGFPVKVNTVVLEDTREDELERLEGFCASVGARLQRIRHFRLDHDKAESESFQRPPSCSHCDRIRLTADGMIKPCLHSDLEVRLDPGDMEGSFREAVLAKPERGGACTNRAMTQIGG